jgi:translation initiation factor 1
MGKRKPKSAAAAATDRVVYSEFGSDLGQVFERPVPDLPPQQQNLRVQVSRKGRKGKCVTVISGFSHAPQTLAKLAKRLKTHCGSGGTVKDNTIEIQGEHGEKLVAWLLQNGYQAKLSGG